MMKNKGAILSFDSLHLAYPMLDLLLDGSGSVNAGELVALAGRNGSGKSTLLRVLAGLADPVSGQVQIDGIAMGAISRQEKARRISFVSTGLVSGDDLTVTEMVALGRYPHTGWWGALETGDKEMIKAALAAVSLEKFANRSVRSLSDGERQRVMIVRALAQDGEVIILDEPTAFLDLPNKFEMIHLLHQLSRKNKAIIYSTHDLEAAWSYSDKLWLLYNSSLHEGSPEDIGLSGLYNKLFKDSTVRLDSRTMRFRPERKTNKDLTLEGEDKEMLRWTKMALYRSGFTTSSASGESLIVHCISSGEKPEWILEHQGTRETFGSIYELISFLTAKE